MDVEQVAADYLCVGASVAVVGASPKADRPSNEIVEYLKNNKMKVFPVNPGHAGKKIHDLECVATLGDLKEKVHIVNVIVSPKFQEKVIREIESLDYKPIVWFQPGAENPEAEKRLKDAGYDVISDACIMVAHILFC